MSSAASISRPAPPTGRNALPVDVYHKMIAQGLLPESVRYELIDGAVVRKDRSAAGEDPKSAGTGHATSVGKLADLNPRLRRARCHMRTQQPLTLPPCNEPEPDGAVVKGTSGDYAEGHPRHEDVLCVFEVADSSLHYDRTKKQQVYADSGLPVYVIISLPERCVEVYTEPLAGTGRYGRSMTLSGRAALRIPTPGGKEIAVPIRQLLP